VNKAYKELVLLPPSYNCGGAAASLVTTCTHQSEDEQLSKSSVHQQIKAAMVEGM